MNGNSEVALVIDDMVSFDPFIARGIRIYGRAEKPIERDGLVGPGHYLRITPTVSWTRKAAVHQRRFSTRLPAQRTP